MEIPREITVFLSVLAFAVGNPVYQRISSSPSDNKFPRIVGGEEAGLNEFPFQVSIQYLGNHICGGVLINLSTILSTASCSELGSPSSFVAVIGKHRLSRNETTAQSRPISRIIMHTGYPGTTGYSNDIAVIKVATLFQISDYVQPIALPPAGGSFTGTATVSGYGSLEEEGSYSDVLMKVDVPIVSDEDCRKSYGESDIEDSMLCAGSEGKDSCSGDNGAPLIVQHGTDKYVIGVVSWGIGCGRNGYPGVYTEITHFLEFINTYANFASNKAMFVENPHYSFLIGIAVTTHMSI